MMWIVVINGSGLSRPKPVNCDFRLLINGDDVRINGFTVYAPKPVNIRIPSVNSGNQQGHASLTSKPVRDGNFPLPINRGDVSVTSMVCGSKLVNIGII